MFLISIDYWKLLFIILLFDAARFIDLSARELTLLPFDSLILFYLEETVDLNVNSFTLDFALFLDRTLFLEFGLFISGLVGFLAIFLILL